MKLDNKVKEDYIIFSCFGTEQAKRYVDRKGYFTNDMGDFNNLNDCYYGTLNVVDDNGSRPYLNKDFSRYFGFFLPEAYVKKQKQKKYRPCTIDDFGLHIGDLIRFRRKGDNDFETCTMYIGYVKTNGTVQVLLGQCCYSFEELFNEYEWFDRDSNTWEMFGVEE